MHENTFLKDVQIKIISVIDVIEIDEQYLLADLVTEQFGRRTQKRHVFDRETWELMRERGYIE